MPSVKFWENSVFEDWIDILLRGSYEVSIPKLTVTSEEIGELHGSGHVSWNADAKIRIQAVTGGGDTLTSLLGKSCLPGHLISHSKYLTFSGRTHDDCEFSGDPIPRVGHRTHSDLPDVIWDLHSRGFTLRHETWSKQRIINILMGPLPPYWTRGTETEVRNEFFGSQQSNLDWLLIESQIGRIAARRRSDAWFEVRVIPYDCTPKCDASTICTAIARAFGLFLGRRCVIRGYEEINENIQIRRIDTGYPETTRNSLLQPLGEQIALMENVERLLGLAIDFFLSELGERVALYLYLCWDIADNSHLTRLAMTSICVEGLLRLAAETLGPTQPQVDQADLTAFRNWLSTTPTGFSQRFLNRLSGLAGMFRNLSANEIFRDWVNRGILGVTRDDSQAWNDIRNPAAHARITLAPNQDELQSRVFSHHRLQNLQNKIILQLMGYTGVYIDYSQPGFPPATFPHAAPP